MKAPSEEEGGIIAQPYDLVNREIHKGRLIHLRMNAIILRQSGLNNRFTGMASLLRDNLLPLNHSAIHAPFAHRYRGVLAWLLRFDVDGR
jgi:hypothetical protein